MSVAIEVDNLKRTYEGTLGMTKKKTIEALRGISFKVNEGEIFGLLGPIKFKHLKNENGSLEDVYIKLIGGNEIA